MCRADIGYTNKGVPSRFKGSMIIAYFLAECDGKLLDFRRIVFVALPTQTYHRLTIIVPTNFKVEEM